MRIIKRFRITYAGKYKCHKCKTEFYVDEDDKVDGQGFPEYRPYERYSLSDYFNCPSCNSSVFSQERRVKV